MDAVILDKFYKNIQKNNYCWNWTGFTDKTGLPIIRHESKEISVRKLALEIAGIHTSKRDRVRSNLSCNNRLCVNPEHLCVGDDARFMTHVHVSPNKNDCWIWKAGEYKDGYGKFEAKGKTLGAHRYSWAMHNKMDCPKTLMVCHTCDTPRCVNPNHLFIGEHQDNVDDKVSKGRQPKGEQLPWTKLTEVEVIEIRRLHSLGHTIPMLIKQFNMSRTGITELVNRKTWKHI